MHLASDQKDLLISQLKAEIFEIQQRDKDYLALRDQLYTIQQKYRHVQDEKLMQDNDYNYRHDQNVVSINSLRKEIEDLRFLLNEKNRSNNEDEDINENEVLFDIFNLNDLETDTVRLSASTIKQLFDDTGYNLSDVRTKKLVKAVFVIV